MKTDDHSEFALAKHYIKVNIKKLLTSLHVSAKDCSNGTLYNATSGYTTIKYLKDMDWDKNVI